MPERKPDKPTMPAGTMMLLPVAPDRCQVCAAKHEPEMPHDAQSIYWAMAARMQGKPAPTWKLAMEHCSPEMRRAWTDELKKMGVEV